MSVGQQTLILVQQAAAKRMLVTPHALSQMSRPDRMITSLELNQVIQTGTVIEDYPTDPRGHSCLVLGRGNQNRPIHVVCAPKPDFLAIITAYLPDPGQWSADFTTRL